MANIILGLYSISYIVIICHVEVSSALVAVHTIVQMPLYGPKVSGDIQIFRIAKNSPNYIPVY